MQRACAHNAGDEVKLTIDWPSNGLKGGVDC